MNKELMPRGELENDSDCSFSADSKFERKKVNNTLLHSIYSGNELHVGREGRFDLTWNAKHDFQNSTIH